LAELLGQNDPDELGAPISVVATQGLCLKENGIVGQAS
jgi:hypothetical protein